MDKHKQKRRFWNVEEEAVDRTLWRTRLGKAMDLSQERQRIEFPCVKRKELESNKRIFKFLHIWMTCCFYEMLFNSYFSCKATKMHDVIVINFV